MTIKIAYHLLRQEKGFTLIELLVTLVIVTLLTSVAVPTLLAQIRRTRIAEAQSALTEVSRSSELHRVIEGIYPDDYSDIGVGTAYATEAFTSTAPNYNNPTILEGAGTSEGILWEATSKGRPYITGTGINLQCKMGVGSFVDETTVNLSCNLKD